MSVRLEIMTRCITKLNGSVGRPADLPDARLRRPLPIDAGGKIKEPELNLYFIREDPRPATNKSGPLTKKELTVIVEVRTLPDAAENVDASLEPAHTWVEKVLSGESLDGFVHIIQFTGLQWAPVYADRIYGVSLMRFNIEYQTKRDDPDAIQ